MFRTRLINFINTNNTTYVQVSAGADVSAPTVSDFIHGKSTVQKTTADKLSAFMNNYADFNANILSYDKTAVLTFDRYNLEKFIHWTKYRMRLLDLNQSDIIKGCGYENITLNQFWSVMKEETKGISFKKAVIIFNFIKYYQMNKTKNNDKLFVINKYRYSVLGRILNAN